MPGNIVILPQLFWLVIKPPAKLVLGYISHYMYITLHIYEKRFFFVIS